jgi:hypothetical protein
MSELISYVSLNKNLIDFYSGLELSTWEDYSMIDHWIKLMLK